MSHLANNLISKGFLKQDLIIEAFSEIGRVEFVPERFAQVADENIALPIGHGQIAPAPSVVAFMLELLAAQRGQRALVVGSGTGWISVLLSYIVGAQGHVDAVDDLPELITQARENVEKYGFVTRDNIVTFHEGTIESGYNQGAPYDRIFIARTLPELPKVIEQQVAVDGCIVAPINDVVVYFHKKENELIREHFDSIRFSQV